MQRTATSHKRALLLCNALHLSPSPPFSLNTARSRCRGTARGRAAQVGWVPTRAAWMSVKHTAAVPEHQPQVSEQLSRSHCPKAGTGRADIRKHECVRARAGEYSPMATAAATCTGPHGIGVKPQYYGSFGHPTCGRLFKKMWPDAQRGRPRLSRQDCGHADKKVGA